MRESDGTNEMPAALRHIQGCPARFEVSMRMPAPPTEVANLRTCGSSSVDGGRGHSDTFLPARPQTRAGRVVTCLFHLAAQNIVHAAEPHSRRARVRRAVKP